jgi:hypothetical protein
MSKNHFIKLAETLSGITRHDDGQTVEFEAVVNSLANFCEAQNPRFNRGRWLDYVAGKCGPNGGKIKA